MPRTVEHQGPIYIRLGRGGDPVIPRAPSIDGLPQVLRQGKNSLVFVATGTATQVAMAAAEITGARVVYVPVIKPLDENALIDAIGKEPDAIATIEDHSIIGGLGSAVAEVLAETYWRGWFERFGYPDCFPEGYGTQDEMRARYGLSADNIAEKMRHF